MEFFFNDVLHQGPSSRRNASTAEDDRCVATLLGDFREGRMLVSWVSAGSLMGGPSSDRDRDGNRRALAGLPNAFSAEVYDGGGAGEDGLLRWARPITMIGIGTDGKVEEVSVPPRQGAIPLEIGSMSGETAFIRMLDWGCLARWPYWASKVTVCLMRPPNYYFRAAADEAAGIAWPPKPPYTLDPFG